MVISWSWTIFAMYVVAKQLNIVGKNISSSKKINNFIPKLYYIVYFFLNSIIFCYSIIIALNILKNIKRHTHQSLFKLFARVLMMHINAKNSSSQSSNNNCYNYVYKMKCMICLNNNMSVDVYSCLRRNMLKRNLFLFLFCICW